MAENSIWILKTKKSNAMKTKTATLLVSLIGVFSILTGCEIELNHLRAPVECADCVGFTFEQNYLKHFQNDEIYYIKGVTIDFIGHGCRIEIVEDLKVNFADKPYITVWGESKISFCDNKGRQDLRMDNVKQYNKNDTLIMILQKKHNSYRGSLERQVIIQLYHAVDPSLNSQMAICRSM